MSKPRRNVANARSKSWPPASKHASSTTNAISYVHNWPTRGASSAARKPETARGKDLKPLFEAQHLKNFMPDAQRRVSQGKQIIAKGKAAEERLVANEANALRGSDAKSMHWSGMRSSSDMPLDLSAVIGLHDLRTSNPEQRAADRLKLTGGVPPFGPADESALEDAWEHFRWTKRVVHSLVERLRMLNAFTVFKTPTFECATAAPVAEAYERMKEHVKAVIDTAAALDEVNSNMSARLQDLEAKVAQVERDAGGGA